MMKKKCLSVIMMFIVAILSMATQAQSSEIYGTWKSEAVADPDESGLKMIVTFSFDEDGRGVMHQNISGLASLDYDVAVDIVMEITASIRWELKKSTLTYRCDKNSLNSTIPKFDIKTNNWQKLDAIRPYMAQLIGQMTEEAEKEFSGKQILTDVIILEDKMTLKDDDGLIFKFIRVE